MVNNILRAVNDAEDRIGRIPTCMEIYYQFLEQRNTFNVKNPYEIGAVIISIYREDMIFSDSVCFQFTTRKHEGFHTFSYHFRQKYPGYGVDRLGAVCALTAKTINFRQQVNMLKSRDPSSLEACRWVYDGDFRFLDGESINNERVGFTSFPRSGNSFLRRVLEQVSGITTGGTVHLHTATSL